MAAFPASTGFLLTGTSAGTAGLVALGAVTAPIAGLAAVVIAGGYVIYMTHEQYAHLLESGQIARWQEEGLNSDLAISTLAPEQVASCRISNSTGLGGGMSYRRCLLEALDKNEAPAGELAQAGAATASLPSVQDRIESKTVATRAAHCTPKDSNEDLMRKARHNDQHECLHHVRNVYPRQLNSAATCSSQASANTFLNHLARCQALADNLNLCLYFLEQRGLLGEYQRRHSIYAESTLNTLQSVIPHLEARCFQQLRGSSGSSPAPPTPSPGGAVQ